MIGYSLTLPLGPSINHYWRKTPTGMRVSEEGISFRQEVWVAVRQAKIPKLTGRICVVLRVFPRDRRLIDIDNRIKAVLDALQKAGVYDDDAQVDDLHVSRGPIVQGGRMELLVGELAGGAAS